MSLKDWVNKNKKGIYHKTIFIIEILIAFVFNVTIYKILYMKADFNFVDKKYIFVYVIEILLLCLIIFNNIRIYKEKIEKLFLTFVIPIGMMFVVLFPIGFVPDEDSHMYKAYDLSCGNFITPLGEKMRVIYMYHKKWLKQLK